MKLLESLLEKIKQWDKKDESGDSFSRITMRFWAFCFYVVFVLFVYFLSSNLLFLHPYTARPLSLDHHFPFWPWTITIYLSHVFLIFFLFLSTPHAYHFRQMFWGYLSLLAISIVFFLVAPFHIPLPSVPGNDFWAYFLRYVRTWDVHVNSLPSLHVSMAIFGPLYLWWTEDFQWKNVFFLIWGILICISTLTTKQHILADVFTGIALAWGMALPLSRCTLLHFEMENWKRKK